MPTDAQMNSHRGWMAIKPRKAWTVDGRTWRADSLLGIRLDAFMATKAAGSTSICSNSSSAVSSGWILSGDQRCRSASA